MAQDLRTLLADEKKKEYFMEKGHEKRFSSRMERELPRKKNSHALPWAMAASLVLLISLGAYMLNDTRESETVTGAEGKDVRLVPKQNISLGDLSPDLKRIEHYYMANINLELSELVVSEDNKAMVDNYLEQLALLNSEYEELNSELNEIGPNDQTISALIRNLQLRLQLLHTLKDKLNQLKSLQHETISTNQI